MPKSPQMPPKNAGMANGMPKGPMPPKGSMHPTIPMPKMGTEVGTGGGKAGRR